MRHKLFGRTGLRVSEFCLGAMTFGTEWGWGSEADESRAVFDAFAEAGGNFIDTANFYTNGTSERMLDAFATSVIDSYWPPSTACRCIPGILTVEVATARA